MSGIVIQDPSTPLVDDHVAASQLVKRGNWCQWRCRANVANIPGIIDPLVFVWEGPFLRIYPARNNVEGITLQARKFAQGESIGVQAGLGAVSASAADENVFYEIDANNQPPFWAPWDCTVELRSNRNRTYAADLFFIEQPEDEASAPKADHRDMHQEFTQTRYIGRNATRTLDVPVGCNEYSIIGATPASLFLELETTSKVGSIVAQTLTNPLLRRYPVGNAVQIVVTGAGGGAGPTGIVFWVRVR